ncbi:hypothetical protein GN956_G2537 [Arapaima gigas]
MKKVSGDDFLGLNAETLCRTWDSKCRLLDPWQLNGRVVLQSVRPKLHTEIPTFHSPLAHGGAAAQGCHLHAWALGNLHSLDTQEPEQ